MDQEVIKPPMLALEWLDKMLARVQQLEVENARLQDYIAHRPTGTKAQRESQMLKRMEAAETECARLRAERDETRHRAVELDHALTETLKLAESAQVENDRLREVLREGAAYIESYHFASEGVQANALVVRMRAVLAKEAGQ